ncbi:flagellar protein FlaG [Onishia taeanensis]|uniref:Flagellar protein FlaG n=1 Tax=Onishia taeanensis TaxID=284577 RepID=A0A1G7RD80_9GAMM|nr:flagellar protein FlaG [Halomonas taeanensis]SDG08614.1 flagellar protein FlaG [Halomonas taeanensis]
MTSPINETGALNTAPALSELTARQRIDSALAQLSPADESAVDGRAAPTASSSAAIGSPGAGELVAPIQRINEVMRSYGIEFSLDEHPSRVVTRIVDRVSGDVIRQIPSEEVLRIAEQLDEMQGRLISFEA